MISFARLQRWTIERFSARRNTAQRERRRIAWYIEELEGRLLLTAYSPAQISQAYGVSQIMFGEVKGDGTGQTIAIIDAYHAPNIQSDLATFNAAFGLPNADGKGAPVLTVATPQGVPAYNRLWAQESTLDVQWAHAIAPGAHILLVEAKSSNLADLFAAVDYARNQPGVSVVSMSWGAAEFSSEVNYGSYFTTPAGHQGVSFIASAGDSGAVTQYPAVSPNVLSVGGTSLFTTDAVGTYSTESGWSKSGGGISIYETKPSYQSTVTQSATKRTGPDVGYVADPSTGVKVYFTDAATGSSAWYVFGGTSAGAPQWAGIVAIANQGRALAGQGTLDGKSQLLPALYNMASTNFHDVTSGTTTNGSTTYTAGAGYDLITGRGSPYANLVVSDLLKVAGTTTTTSGGTTSGGTTSGGGGSTKGGGKGRPKLERPDFDVAALAAIPHFAFGESGDTGGLFPVDGPAPASANSESPPVHDNLAGRFAALFVSPNAAPAWGHSSGHENGDHALSGQMPLGRVNHRSEHTEECPSHGAPDWSEPVDRWSERDWTATKLESPVVDRLASRESAPSHLVDTYFISLARGELRLPNQEAA